MVFDLGVVCADGECRLATAGRPNDEIILGPEFSPEEQAAATRREVRS